MIRKIFFLSFSLLSFFNISEAQTSYSPFNPKGGLDILTNYNLGINNNVSKPLQDKFTDSVDAADFGVKCDATLDTTSKTATGTDDTVAMQNAITYAANNGKTLHIHTGSCLISKTLAVPTGTAKSFYFDGEGSTILFTGTGNTIQITEPSVSADYLLKRYAIENFKFIVPADNYVNTVAIDIENNGMRGIIRNVFIKGYQTGVKYLNTAGQTSDNVSIYSWGASNYGFYISGTWSGGTSTPTAYNANNKIYRSTVIYGSGAYIGHAVQGISFDNFSTLESQGWGIYCDVAANDGTEALEVSNSYIEAYNGGIYLDGMSFSHITSVNFDAPTFGLNSTSWSAIHALKMFGGIVANNTVDGFGGSSVGTFIIGGDAIITGNNITGLTKDASVPCMDLYPSSDSNTNMIVSNNKCWAAGGFNVSQNTGNIFGTNNLWSGLNDNTNTVVNFGTTFMNDGSVTGTLSTHSQNVSGSTSTTKGSINLFSDSYISFGATNSSGYGVAYLGNDTHGNVKISGGGLGLSIVTMANLPTSCITGTEYFVSDARNTGEASGSGTGAVAYCNSKSVWMVNGSSVSN